MSKEPKPPFYEGGEHPLRTLARELLLLGQGNECWSQVYEPFGHLSSYCQLVAGYNEGIQREAKFHQLFGNIRGVLDNAQLDDAAKIVRIKTLMENPRARSG